MEVSFSCPECGKRYSVSEELGGMQMQCASCKNLIDVPKVLVVQRSRKSIRKQISFWGRIVRLLIIAAIVSVKIIAASYYLHSNLFSLPLSLRRFATCFGTPVQRAKACQALAFQFRNRNVGLEGPNPESEYYFEKGLKILENCPESAKVLKVKIPLKYRGDISGWVSEDGEKLIKLSKDAILTYVRSRNRLGKLEAKDGALLKEFESLKLAEVEKEGLSVVLADTLAQLYSFDAPGFPLNLPKVEFYLLEALKKEKNLNYLVYRLINCYASQGKMDKMEEVADEFLKSCKSDGGDVLNLARFMVDIHTSQRSSMLFGGDEQLKTPENYEKAVKWLSIAKRLSPGIEKFYEKQFQKSFPDKAMP